MDKKTILFNNIRKHIKNVEVYNMLTTSYLNDTYTVFLEKVHEEQYKILELYEGSQKRFIYWVKERQI